MVAAITTLVLFIFVSPFSQMAGFVLTNLLLFVFFGKMLAAESLDTEVGTTSFFLSTEPTCSAGLVEPPNLRGLIFGLLVVSLLGAFPKDACLIGAAMW